MPVAKVRLNFSELIDHGAEERKLEDEKYAQLLDNVLRDTEIALSNSQNNHDGDVEVGVVHNLIVRDLTQKYLKWLVLSAKLMKFRYSPIAHFLGYAFTILSFVEITLFIILLEGSGNSTSAHINSLNIIVDIYFMLVGLLKVGAIYAYVIVKYNDITAVTPRKLIEIVIQSGGLEIVSGCCSLAFLGTRTGCWFDLVRMVMMTIAVLEGLPHIDVLMSGIVLGLQSLASMWMLLIMVFFIYAACALTFFSGNDPFHFGSIAMSMWSFFEMCTFDGWEKILYINMYGCDKYPTYYVMGESVGDDSPRVYDRHGQMYMPICDNPEPRPLLAAATFVSFTLLCGFILISLTVASVTGGIKDRLDEFNESSNEDKSDSIKRFQSEHAGDATRFDADLAMTIMEQVWKEQAEGQTRRKKILMKRDPAVKMLAASPDALLQLQQNYYRKRSIQGYIDEVWLFLSDPMSRAVTMRNTVGHLSYRFLFALLVILGAFLEVWSLQKREITNSVAIAQAFFQVCYTLDIVFNMMAHYPKYTSYFQDNWNVFDITLVVITWIPFFLQGVRGSEYIGLLRVLRILRVLRLLTWVSRLNIMLKSMATSSRALIYVIFLMCALFYHFAVAGVLMFDSNDPHHFGTIYRAFITLWQMCSLANWTWIARTQMYGCDLFGYRNGLVVYDELCVQPNGQGWLAAWFFIVFIVSAVMVLVNLFVGVTITSMELLKEGVRQEQKIWELAKSRQKLHLMKDTSLGPILEVFEMADSSDSATLTLLEVQKVLRLVIADELDQIALFMKVDVDNNGQLNFAEFVDVVHLLGEARHNPKADDSKGTDKANKTSMIEDLAKSKYMTDKMKAAQYAVLAAMASVGKGGDATDSGENSIAAAAFKFKSKIKKSTSQAQDAHISTSPQISTQNSKVRKTVSFADFGDIVKRSFSKLSSDGDNLSFTEIPQVDGNGTSEGKDDSLSPSNVFEGGDGEGVETRDDDGPTTDETPAIKIASSRENDSTVMKTNKPKPKTTPQKPVDSFFQQTISTAKAKKVVPIDDEHRVVTALQTVRKLQRLKHTKSGDYLHAPTRRNSVGDEERRDTVTGGYGTSRAEDTKEAEVELSRGNIEALLTIRHLRQKKKLKADGGGQMCT